MRFFEYNTNLVKITNMILDKICWIWHQCLQNNKFDVRSILTHESKKNHDWLFKNTNIDSYKLKEALLTIQLKKSSTESYKSKELGFKGTKTGCSNEMD